MPMDTLAGFGFGLTHAGLTPLVENWEARTSVEPDGDPATASTPTAIHGHHVVGRSSTSTVSATSSVGPGSGAVDPGPAAWRCSAPGWSSPPTPVVVTTVVAPLPVAVAAATRPQTVRAGSRQVPAPVSASVVDHQSVRSSEAEHGTVAPTDVVPSAATTTDVYSDPF